jgi:putative transposase
MLSAEDAYFELAHGDETVVVAVLRSHLNEGLPLSEVAHTAGVPLRSVQRWLARYRAAGLVGLARAQRSATGQRKLPGELVQVIEGMALRTPRLSIAAMHRSMTALATQHHWTPPAYGSVYGIVRQLSPAMVTLAQDGPAAFRDRYELIYRHRAAGPNALWQADHPLLDVLVLDANGEAVRPWLTIIMDDYSRAEAGDTIFLEAPTTLQTALALRQALWRKQQAAWPVCGIPDVLYVDHGSDFTSTHLASRKNWRKNVTCAIISPILRGSLPDRVQVIDLIPRQDLERKIKTLR